MAGQGWPSDATMAAVSQLTPGEVAALDLLLLEYWRHTCAWKDIEHSMSIADSLNGLRKVAKRLERQWREWSAAVETMPE